MAAKDGSFSFDFAGVYDDVQPHRRNGCTMADGHAWEIRLGEEEGGKRVTGSFDPEDRTRSACSA